LLDLDGVGLAEAVALAGLELAVPVVEGELVAVADGVDANFVVVAGGGDDGDWRGEPRGHVPLAVGARQAEGAAVPGLAVGQGAREGAVVNPGAEPPDLGPAAAEAPAEAAAAGGQGVQVAAFDLEGDDMAVQTHKRFLPRKKRVRS